MKNVFLLVLAIIILNCNLNAQWEQCNMPNSYAFYDLLTVGDKIYAGSYTSALYLSTNAGKDWDNIIDTSGIIGILCIANYEDKIFIGTASGVYYTTNDGVTWINANIGISDYVIFSLFINEKYIFASTQGKGLLRSSDLGQSWEQVNDIKSDSWIYSIVLYDNKILANASYQGFMCSSDNGETWTAIDTTLANFGVYDIVTTKDKIYVGTNKGIFYSTDSGYNWIELNNCLKDIFVRKIIIEGTNFTLATNKGIYFSTDNGISWLEQVLPNVDIRCITKCGSNLYAGTFLKGLMMSSDNGETWTNIYKGLPTQLISCFTDNGSNLFATASNFGVLKSSDNGNVWFETNLCTYNEGFNCIASDSSNILVGYNDSLFVSSDNGETWTGNKIQGFCNFITGLIIKDTLWIVGTNGTGIFISANKGKDWKTIAPGKNPQNRIIYQVECIDSNIYCISHLNDSIYVTGDYGETWKEFAQNAGFNKVNCMKFYGSKVYLGTNKGLLFSSDNGETWTNYGPELTNSQTVCLAIKDNNIFLGTDNAGVFLSTNNGESWKEISEGLISLVIQSLFIKGDNIFVGTNYGGAYQAKLSDFGITDVEEKTEVKNDFSIFPNPATDIVTINCTENQISSISIVNSLGMEVKRIENNVLLEKNSINISTEDLPTGMYYCILSNQGSRITKSFVVLR